MAEPLDLLLVEDCDDLALLMRKFLGRAGHRVTVCGSAEDGLIVLGDSRFDLIILDQSLPGMSGLDFLHCLNREGNTTPVIMRTGNNDESLRAQALRAGALDFVGADPILTFLEELPERVSNMVKRFRSS